MAGSWPTMPSVAVSDGGPRAHGELGHAEIDHLAIGRRHRPVGAAGHDIVLPEARVHRVAGGTGIDVDLYQSRRGQNSGVMLCSCSPSVSTTTRATVRLLSSSMTDSIGSVGLLEPGRLFVVAGQGPALARRTAAWLPRDTWAARAMRGTGRSSRRPASSPGSADSAGAARSGPGGTKRSPRPGRSRSAVAAARSRRGAYGGFGFSGRHED